MVKCPVCSGIDLVPAMTRQGVKIDFCQQCEGIWLDKDEIYHFSRTPTYLKTTIEEAIKTARTSNRLSPVADKPMLEISIPAAAITLDYCADSEGIWLDKEEINSLPAIKTEIKIDKGVLKKDLPGLSLRLFPLPNLALRSMMVLFSLYAALTLILILVVEFGMISAAMALFIGVTFAVVQFLLGPFLMDLSLRFLYKMAWVGPQELPVHLTEFISKTCNEKKIPFPRMGIIADGSPNAFTYGHHPHNARIVITQGLLTLLSDEEAEAVVAHEIGHVLHWDMLIMTMAQLVPLVLYYIYRTLSRIKVRGKDKSAPYRFLIAVCAYVLYIASEYLVLWFSRLREYFADRFSGEVTGDPNALARALVKIGYGLAGEESCQKSTPKEGRDDRLNATGTLGIFDSKTASILAISAYRGVQKMGGEIDKGKLREAARWDHWNPWAGFYELQSTHPLIAKRIMFLSNQSRVLGKDPFIEFNENRPESYWDDFLTDVIIKVLPFIALVVCAVLFFLKSDPFFLSFGLFLSGAFYLILILFSYPCDGFADMTVRSLLGKVKVSAVRPVPCFIKGTIIGRGVPGLIYSEDFVLQDETGIIFLDYRQPLGIIDFFFGLLRAKDYINSPVEITGWYRRSPVPYIEIKKMKVEGKNLTCYAYYAKLLFAIAIVIAGIYFTSTTVSFLR